MPIEIRELVIRARIDPGGERPAASGSQRAAKGAERQDAIIQACVREVLRILEDKKER